jgi:hypothetical protein
MRVRRRENGELVGDVGQISMKSIKDKVAIIGMGCTKYP